MIPSFLGNAVGGGLFTGVVYWYLFLSGGEEIEVFEGEMTLQDRTVYEQVSYFYSPPFLFLYSACLEWFLTWKDLNELK